MNLALQFLGRRSARIHKQGDAQRLRSVTFEGGDRLRHTGIDHGKVILLQPADGLALGGPSAWTAGVANNCANGNFALICMMKTFTNGVAVTGFTGKKVWMSNAPYLVSAAGNPDTTCNNDKPAGVLSGRALIARTTSTAASALTAAQMYVRPDGQEVGTGAAIGAGQAIGGIWQFGDGSYATRFQTAWTGSTAIDQVGDVTSTCGNWTNSGSAAGRMAHVNRSRYLAWSFTTIACNTTVATGAPYLYCYEP